MKIEPLWVQPAEAVFFFYTSQAKTIRQNRKGIPKVFHMGFAIVDTLSAGRPIRPPKSQQLLKSIILMQENAFNYCLKFMLKIKLVKKTLEFQLKIRM